MYTAFSDLHWIWPDDDRRSKHVAALNTINNKVVLDVYIFLIIIHFSTSWCPPSSSMFNCWRAYLCCV